MTLRGIAEVITDKNVLHEFWKDFFMNYYPAGPDDGNYCLIRFTTWEAVCWIDGKKKGFCL